jgi:hypothetical protein
MVFVSAGSQEAIRNYRGPPRPPAYAMIWALNV